MPRNALPGPLRLRVASAARYGFRKKWSGGRTAPGANNGVGDEAAEQARARRATRTFGARLSSRTPEPSGHVCEQ